MGVVIEGCLNGFRQSAFLCVTIRRIADFSPAHRYDQQIVSAVLKDVCQSCFV
jgi:5'-nucleotidase